MNLGPAWIYYHFVLFLTWCYKDCANELIWHIIFSGILSFTISLSSSIVVHLTWNIPIHAYIYTYIYIYFGNTSPLCRSFYSAQTLSFKRFAIVINNVTHLHKIEIVAHVHNLSSAKRVRHTLLSSFIP